MIKRDIIGLLCTPGTFVLSPKGEPGCVLAFNATTNEVEVTFSPTAFGEELSRGLGRHAQRQFEDEMRANGVWRSYHFDQLRLAPPKLVEQLTGAA